MGTKRKDIKSEIIADIIRLVQESGGRFLRRSENNSNIWCLADYQCCHEKVSHALRSKRNRKKKSNKENFHLKTIDQQPRMAYDNLIDLTADGFDEKTFFDL